MFTSAARATTASSHDVAQRGLRRKRGRERPRVLRDDDAERSLPRRALGGRGSGGGRGGGGGAGGAGLLASTMN